MRYNNRIKLIRKVPSNDPYKEFDTVVEEHACSIAGLKMDMNIGVFGQYQPNAMGIHLRGTQTSIYQVEYSGAKVTPKAVLSTRGNTVIVIGG